MPRRGTASGICMGHYRKTLAVDPYPRRRTAFSDELADLCSLELFNAFITATLLKRPDIDALLHAQPDFRAVAQRLAQANRHVRRHPALFAQDLRHGQARNSQIVSEFFLCQAQRW